MMSLEGSEYSGNREGESLALDISAGASSEHSMEHLVEQRERHDELRQALAGLPELDRQLVYLRYFQLASTEDICQRTKLSRHAIDTRLWRARKALRDVLEERLHGRVRAR